MSTRVFGKIGKIGETYIRMKYFRIFAKYDFGLWFFVCNENDNN